VNIAYIVIVRRAFETESVAPAGRSCGTRSARWPVSRCCQRHGFHRSRVRSSQREASAPVTFMEYDLGCFDDETCRLEPRQTNLLSARLRRHDTRGTRYRRPASVAVGRAHARVSRRETEERMCS
jgi:hypothetical protein